MPTWLIRCSAVSRPSGGARAHTRSRRGRGVRGPLALPGPLNPTGSQPRPTRRDDFDDLVLSLVERISDPVVEPSSRGSSSAPRTCRPCRRTGVDEPIPFGAVLRATGQEPARIVLFRRPIELRAKTRVERTALVNEVLVEHVAELLGRDPAEIDP